MEKKIFLEGFGVQGELGQIYIHSRGADCELGGGPALVLIEAPHYGFSGPHQVFMPKGCLWPGSPEHIVPAPPEPHDTGQITPCAPAVETDNTKPNNITLPSMTLSTSLPRGQEPPSNRSLGP